MSSEFKNFDTTMRKLITVPHSEIKAKLEAEKKEKAEKKSIREHHEHDSEGKEKG